MSVELITGIAGILAGFAGIISAILLNRKTMALLEYRMEQVERKLDNNNTVDRIARMETDIAVIKTNIQFIKDGGGKN